jgi:DNA polymerase-3 subunit epsilon
MVRLPDWPTPCGQHWVARPDRHPGLTRSIARSAPRAQSFVGTLVASLDQRALLPIDAPPTAMGYLQVLDRALADRRVSNDELAELTAVAAMYELGHQDIQQLHERYLAQLLAVAMADGIVTTREQADLELVADLLGIAEPLQITPSALPDAPPMLEGLAGKTVCFTGALTCWRDGKPMTREHASTLASAAGLIVCPRVTQSLDLLVVADPESMSGKARKARDYGTRIIAETAFWPLIGVEVT